MSSSRSVAAARARRASADVVQKPPMSVRQQQQQMMGQRPNPNQRMTNPAAMAPMPEPVMQQERRPKIEVGTAIGLVTLRLGRIEQFIQEISENGHIKKDLVASSGSTTLPDNSKIVDNSVFTSLVSRLDGVERKQNSLEMEIKSVKDMLINLNASVERAARDSNEKLKQLNDKMKENGERLQDYEAALSDIESRIQFNPEESYISGEIHGNDDEDEPEGVSYEIADA
jgi:hypothetical protein